MHEDILNGNYKDPMLIDNYGLDRLNAFEENVKDLAESLTTKKFLTENSLKYSRKRKDLQNEVDYETCEEDYKELRRVVKNVKEPWTEDQSFVWPDHIADSFEKDLEQFRQRPVSNTGYENKALNKKMQDRWGKQATKCIDDTLFDRD